jgi:thiamine pyrophosphokinase
MTQTPNARHELWAFFIVNESRSVIIANGEAPAASDVARWLRAQDMLVCADGGARVALRLGLAPQHVVGDFDSLEPGLLDTLVARGAQLHRYPPAKNETDLELALAFCAANSDEIIVLGALGGRVDHALANMLLLAMHVLRGKRVIIAHGPERIQLIDARETPASLALYGNPGALVSLLPFGGDAHGIRTTGLEYPLVDESLLVGPARGVSNVLLSTRADVFVRQGLLLCIATDARTE